MSDLIDRQAAVDALWKALYEYEDKTKKQFIESDDLDIEDWIQHRIFIQNMSDIDRKTIMELPSAQPERKTGRWTSGDKMRDYPRVPYRAWKTYCSECGEEALLDMDCSDYVLTPYCPNCGAKMEVEHEAENT